MQRGPSMPRRTSGTLPCRRIIPGLVSLVVSLVLLFWAVVAPFLK